MVAALITGGYVGEVSPFNGDTLVRKSVEYSCRKGNPFSIKTTENDGFPCYNPAISSRVVIVNPYSMRVLVGLVGLVGGVAPVRNTRGGSGHYINYVSKRGIPAPNLREGDGYLLPGKSVHYTFDNPNQSYLMVTFFGRVKYLGRRKPCTGGRSRGRG